MTSLLYVSASTRPSSGGLCSFIHNLADDGLVEAEMCRRDVINNKWLFIIAFAVCCSKYVYWSLSSLFQCKQYKHKTIFMLDFYYPATCFGSVRRGHRQVENYKVIKEMCTLRWRPWELKLKLWNYKIMKTCHYLLFSITKKYIFYAIFFVF
jgi:hypothetical protein